MADLTRFNKEHERHIALMEQNAAQLRAEAFSMMHENGAEWCEAFMEVIYGIRDMPEPMPLMAKLAEIGYTQVFVEASQ